MTELLIEEYIDDEMKQVISEIMPLLAEQCVLIKPSGFCAVVSAYKMRLTGRCIRFALEHSNLGFEAQLSLFEGCYEVRVARMQDILNAKSVGENLALASQVFEHPDSTPFGLKHKRTMVQRLVAILKQNIQFANE